MAEKAAGFYSSMVTLRVMDMAESGETLRVAVIPDEETTSVNLVADSYGVPPAARRTDFADAGQRAGEAAGTVLAQVPDWGLGADGAPTNKPRGTPVPAQPQQTGPREVIPTYPPNGGQEPPKIDFPRGVPQVPQGGYGPIEEKPFPPGSNPRGIDAPPVVDPRPEKQKEWSELSLLGFVVGGLAMLHRGTRPAGVIAILGSLLWQNRPR